MSTPRIFKILMRIMPKRTSSWIRIAGVILGGLVFTAANGADYLSLEPHQLRILQRIVHLIGLGLVVIFTVGKYIDRWAVETLERLDKWILGGGRRASFLLIVLILAYTVMWDGITFLRHYYFHSRGFDLGIQDQVVWNTAQGRPFSSSFEVTNYLGDHVQPYLVLPSLVYVVLPSPYVLLAFQSFVLALSAWPLYCLGRRKFNSPAIGLAVVFCGLAYPPLGFLNRADFHSEVVAVPLLIAAYERVDVDDLKVAAVFMGLALFAKEDTGLTIAALGLIVALYHKHWRFGLTWAFVGVAYSLIALFVIIPAFRGAPSDTLARYQWLGDTPLEMLRTIVSRPGFILQRIITAKHLLTSLQLLAPLAFLPLLSLPALLPAVPTLLYNYMVQFPFQETIYFHYMATVIPFMSIAGVLGLHWLTTNAWGGRFLGSILPRKMRPGQGIGLGLSMMLLATLASWAYENPIITNTLRSSVTVRQMEERGRNPEALSSPPIIQSNDATIREALKHVPDDAYLVTTLHYAPHLSQRRNIRVVSAPEPILGSGVEAIFLNLKDLRIGMGCEDYRQYLKLAARSGFGVTFYQDGVLLVERGAGDFGQLKRLLDSWPSCE